MHQCGKGRNELAGRAGAAHFTTDNSGFKGLAKCWSGAGGQSGLLYPQGMQVPSGQATTTQPLIMSTLNLARWHTNHLLQASYLRSSLARHGVGTVCAPIQVEDSQEACP
eukprot:1850620-Amphidinium_carterae.1